MDNQVIDVLIIGGGLTGMALMLALESTGLTTRLVETTSFSHAKENSFDARTLALSPASVNILQTLHVWSLLEKEATPIETIHVSNQGHFGFSQLHKTRETPLGQVIEMNKMTHALHKLLNKDCILSPAHLVAIQPEKSRAIVQHHHAEVSIQAKLIVGADGSHSNLRTLSKLRVDIKKYEQHALVTNVELAHPHGNQAFERFTPCGPLALLPMSELRMALVWTLPPDQATALRSASAPQFLAKLQRVFGYRLGRFVSVGKRSIFPLQQIIMPTQTAWPLVFVGNAAHTLHPVAGQGFNLGLRDVATLAQCIMTHGLNPDMLKHYASLRWHDQKMMMFLTDGLIELFTCQLPGVASACNLGLIAFDNLPFLKKIFLHYVRGYGGESSDLACGIRLDSRKKHE